jgi:murein DD-endopeptidase MepM/ murein hydrolase activator NlpD
MASLYVRLTYSALSASLLLAPLQGRAQDAGASQPLAAPPAADAPVVTNPPAPAARPLDDDRYTPPASAAPTTASTSSSVAPSAAPAAAPMSAAPRTAPALTPVESAPLPAPTSPAAPAPEAAPPPAAKPSPVAARSPSEARAAPPARAFILGKVESDAEGVRIIKVAQGDTVDQIAKRLMVTSEAVIAANKLKKPYALDIGQTLKIPTPKDYVIQTGDTLSGVSRRFEVTPALLAELNGFDIAQRLHTGQKIALPAGVHDLARSESEAPTSRSRPEAAPVQAPDDSEPSAAPPPPPAAPPSSSAEPSHPIPYGEVSPGPAPAAKPAPEAEPSAPPPERAPARVEPEVRLSVKGRVVPDKQKSREMRVGAGDTVNIIADRLLTPREALIKLNHLKKPYELEHGEILRIPTPTAYVAEAGDTLAGVAKRFGTTAAVLGEIDDMDESQRLYPGQKVGLPTDVHDGGPVRTVIAPPPRYTFGQGEPGYGHAEPPSRLSSPPAYSGPPVADQPPAPSDAQIIAAGKGRFAWPVSGHLLSGFGPKPGGQRNDGMDLSAPLGAPVMAAADGDVVYAGNLVPGFGNLVLIRHEDGWVSAYAYLQRIGVKIRDHVRQGDQIGEVGQTGGVDQPQLHFEIRYAPNPKDKARPIDPTLVLPSR